MSFDEDVVIVTPLAGAALAAEPPSRRGPAATAEVRAEATRLGLTGPLGELLQPPGLSAGGSAAVRLEQNLLDSAALAWDTPRLATALVWVKEFQRQIGRDLFIPALSSCPAGAYGRLWNRRSLDLLTKFITSSVPLGRTRGTHVSQDVAESYASAIYLLRCREAQYDVAPVADSFVSPLDAKTTKRKEPPTEPTELGEGLRAHDFLAADAAGFDRTSDAGQLRWAAGVGAHNLLLRGGELGTPDNARHEPRRVLRGRSFRWQRASRASRGRLWLSVLVIPVKDRTGKHPGFLTPVARRHDGPFGADPLCAYDAFAAAYWRKGWGSRPFPMDALGRPADGWWLTPESADFLDLPFFGARWTTETSRRLFKAIAVAAGKDPRRIGGKAARIGGSTDAKERTGEAGKDIIRRRGRWASDVAEVYQRELVGVQLALSAALGESCGEELEALCCSHSPGVDI